jgi:hypothetical protein
VFLFQKRIRVFISKKKLFKVCDDTLQVETRSFDFFFPLKSFLQFRCNGDSASIDVLQLQPFLFQSKILISF